MNTKLYMELLKTRNNIRTKYASGGRTPNVCSDDSIYEMAKLMPKSKEEFLNIKGLGPSFVEKYGNIFIKVINKFSETIETSVLSKDIKSTLKNLESRLVNISKRNHLLYLGKLYPKYAFDMYFYGNEDYNQKLPGLITKATKSLVLADISQNGSQKKEHASRYKRLTTLIREINKDQRETGEYNLYMGYPFAVGKINRDDFDVCAPLVLFPISIDKTVDKITIKIDENRDILFNNNLILTHNKFNNINKELPNNTLEEVSSSFIADVSSFFKQNGINIPKNLPELSTFPEYTAETFPKLEKGEYKLLNTFVLGKFSLYESSLQRDFKAICAKPNISTLLSDLLKNVDEIDIYNETETKATTLPDSFPESTLNYINQLNISQENAIRAIEQQNELVIQGPPGTGKSQTIASLIANAVCKGQNVLMVSQKKAALDVIYSRLGTCANQTLLLHDTKDKENFYAMLDKTYSFSRNRDYDSGKFYDLSRLIDRDLTKLQTIAETLYSSQTHGYKMYKIYQENPENIFTKENPPALKNYYSVVPSNLIAANYEELKAAKQTLLNKKELASHLSYYTILLEHPWLVKIKDSLSLLQKQNMQEALQKFTIEQKEFMQQGFFAKTFGKAKRKKELKRILKTYFIDKKPLKYLFKNYISIPQGLENFKEFKEKEPAYQTLSKLEKIYIEAIYTCINTTETDPIFAVNSIYDFVVLNIIDEFETQNHSMLSDLKNYSFICKQVSDSINEKKDVTKEKLRFNLQESISEFIKNSKRYNEIRRVAESKRKWSVNKFIQKFGFELFRGIKVWLMTPETVSEVLPLQENLFDIVVFDEASQIYIEKGIPSIARAKKVVVSGDHKQLRPSSLGIGRATYDDEEYEDEDDDLETNAALEEESLLDLARFKYPEVLLNYHYRAKYAELINFSNYAFYKGKLNVAPNIETPSKPPIEYIKVANGIWDNRSNKQEAERVVKLVKEIFANRENEETLGVITFNSAQRELILDMLDAECAKDANFAAILSKETNRRKNGEDIGFFVKNIENVQGDERDIIILSLSYARNPQGKIIRNFGWLNQLGGENRLNVAISRAKQKIYLITSLEPNELVTSDLKNEGPKLFRKYMEYASAISSGNKKLANTILSSFISETKQIEEDTQENILVASLKSNLEKLGFEICENVGIGNYKFDLAIKSKDGNKFTLGLIWDESSYTLSSTARERDISSASYYAARGWKTYRVWSSEWWHNKNKIIAEIKELVGNN